MSEITFVWIISLIQVLIALGLVNVWLVRSGRATKYRGGSAKNMKEEFSVYGLPAWSVYVVGFLKIVIALVMVIGLFKPQIMYPFGMAAFVLLAVLMLGAISMHIRVRDSLMKTLPAISMFALAVLGIYFLSIF